MLKKLLTIVAAMGLILPGTSILAQTAHEQTEKQEMFQKGSPGTGERVLERTRTREETQAREFGEDANTYQRRYQKQAGRSDAEGMASGDKLQDRDRIRDKDQLRDRDRLHDGSGGQYRKGGR